MKRYLQCLVVMSALLVSLAAKALSPVHVGADLHFAAGSSELRGEEIDKLEVMRCRVGKSQVEVLVAVGHASSDEPKAELLAAARAESVSRWVAATLGWESIRVHTESKGAKQPVADNRSPEGRARNRRVELEFVFSTRDISTSPCRPRWQNHFLDLPAKHAMIVARSLVHSGRTETDSLFKVAMNELRLDLFEGLLDRESGLILDATQRGMLVSRALAQVKPAFFRLLISTASAPVDRQQLVDGFYFACIGRGSQQDKAELVSQLLALGVKPEDGRALECAATSGNQAMVDLLLSAGAARFLTPQTVVHSGPYAQVLDRLLQAGADPRSKTVVGATLFHTVRLRTVADVQRLLDFGLDINAKGRIFPSNPDTTPLREAIAYAKPEVLDYMKAAGARVDGTDWLNSTSSNVAGQIWLVRNGFDMPDWGNTLVILASQGESRIPVFEALKARGIDLGAKSAGGDSALGMAIRRYWPQMVQMLVESGVDAGRVRSSWSYTSSMQTALEAAENLSVFVPLAPCPISGCTLSTEQAERRIDPELKRRKEQILEILKTAR